MIPLIKKINVSSLIVYLIVFIPTISQIRWFLSFAPFTEGWWLVYSRSILAGKVPYRDFELLSTPLYPYLVASFSAIFGEEFFKFRILGLLIHLAINILLYLVLRNYVKSIFAALIASISTLFIQNSTAYINYDYNYVALLFALLSLYYLSISEKIRLNFIYVSGIFLGLSFLVKQTFGLSILILYIIANIIFFNFDKIFRIVTGFLIPNLIFLLYFVLNNSGQNYVESILRGASESKGGTQKLLIGWIPRVFGSVESFAYFTFLSISLCVILFMIFRIQRVNSIFVILLVFVYIVRFESTNEILFTSAYKFIWLTPGIWLTYKLLVTVIKHRIERQYSLWIYSFGIFLASMLSAGLSEIGSFMPLAASMVYITNRLNNEYLKYIVLIPLFISFLLSIDQLKSDKPYAWWNYSVARNEGNSITVNSGLQSNLVMTENEYLNRNKILSIIPQTKHCQSFIQFPHMPYFQLEKGCQTFGYYNLFWPDFTSEGSLDYIQKNIDQFQVILINLGNASAFETQASWFNSNNDNYVGEIESRLLYRVNKEVNNKYDFYFEESGLRFFVYVSER
jgi:uncharacterized membrane protein